MAHKNMYSVYIGRFNPAHLGHAAVIKEALKTSEHLIILVGSSGYARSLKNPFTFSEREQMLIGILKEQLGDNYKSRVSIRPLRDYLYNDNLWIEQVQRVVFDVTCGETDISIIGSDRDESTWYLSAFPQWKLNLVPEHVLPQGQVSATRIRSVLYSNSRDSSLAASLLAQRVPKSSVQFLVDFMKTDACELLKQEQEHNNKYKEAWSVAPYAPIFSTVDAVVIQSGHVLLVERGAFPGKGLWALPGGFLNQNERLAAGCIRELYEETGIKLPQAMLESIIKTAPKEIFDRPDRSSRGRTITTAFLLKLDDTKPLPKVKGMNMPLHETGGKVVVETAKAFWIPIHEALSQPDKFFEDHASILEWAVGR